MNEIIIIYGSFEDKKIVIEPDSLMLYTEKTTKEISNEELSTLLTILSKLDENKNFRNGLDKNYYSVLVKINGNESEYRGIIDGNCKFNEVLSWLGDLDVR